MVRDCPQSYRNNNGSKRVKVFPKQERIPQQVDRYQRAEKENQKKLTDKKASTNRFEVLENLDNEDEDSTDSSESSTRDYRRKKIVNKKRSKSRPSYGEQALNRNAQK